MSDGVNKCIFIGNLGRDPEMRYTANGKAVATFSLAVSRTFGKGEGRTEETEWVNVVVWEQQAEFLAQYATKGQKCYVEGRLASRSWDGPDGQKKYRTEVIAEKALLLSRSDTRGAVADGSYPRGGDIDPDDLPFD